MPLSELLQVIKSSLSVCSFLAWNFCFIKEKKREPMTAAKTHVNIPWCKQTKTFSTVGISRTWTNVCVHLLQANLIGVLCVNLAMLSKCYRKEEMLVLDWCQKKPDLNKMENVGVSVPLTTVLMFRFGMQTMKETLNTRKTASSSQMISWKQPDKPFVNITFCWGAQTPCQPNVLLV